MIMHRAIGSSRPRADAKVFVEGRGCYLDDVQVGKVLHVAFLRSPHAKAAIKFIRTEDAAAAEGVVGVYKAADLAPVCRGWDTSQTYPGLVMRSQTALAASEALYVGQPVVAVLAETRALAEDAIELIEVDWEPLAGACRLDEALAADTARAHCDLADNSAYRAQIGDEASDDPFTTAALVVEESFSFHRLTGCSMETRGVIASYLPGDDSLTVHQSHTAPHQLRSLYAAHLGLDEGRVRVVCPHVGGSFGVKIHLYADEIATVAIARLVGRPVKFVADRIESFVSDIHAREQLLTARLALDHEGRFLGWEGTSLLAIGPFSTHPGSSVQEGDEALRMGMAPYRVPYARGRLDVVFQNKTVVGQYRGVGHPIGTAIGEYMIDKAAAQLGIEPAELRLRNYIPDDSYPVRTRTGVDLEALSHQKCTMKLLELIDLPKLRMEHTALRAQGIFRGIGFATFVERTATNAPSAAHIRKATAQDGITLAIDPSGAVRCAISVTDQGQGTHAVIGQIVADSLGVSADSVRVVSGDSQATPYGSGVRASRGTPVGGELALQASRQLRFVVLKAAAGLLQMHPDALDMRDGLITPISGGTPSISLADLAEIVYFKPNTLPAGPQISLSLSMHLGHDWPALVPTNGIQACLAEVDVRTGFVRLLRHWAVDDFGTIVNPLLVSEQVRGGIAQGIGQALYEELVYSDEGQLTNGTFADYFVPSAADLPDIVVEHVETPWPYTQLGAKGAGEAGTTGALGAVLNAVNDAIRPLGAKITELPMTPARLLKALGRL
jgi:aerobic carbon-monoxide dehydrogenase large subunit